MIKKLLGYINIHPDKNQSWLLISLVISGLLITYAHPTLVKEIISNLPAQWIAFESLAASIAGLLIGMIWQKNVRKKAIRYFYLGAIMNPSAMIEFNAWPIKEITNKHYQVNNLKRLQQKLTQHYQSQSCELQR